MIGLWIAATLLSAGAAALILYRARRVLQAGGAPDPAIVHYRRALFEIDDFAKRDLAGPDETRGLRTEAARRLLAAAGRGEQPVSGGRSWVALAAAAAASLCAALIYLLVGSPGTPDQPFAGRLAAWRANPEADQPAQLAAALRDVARQHPGDAEPLRRLAALDLAMGDGDGAAHALRQALAINPANADLLAALGEVQVLKSQGKVDPDARALFTQALLRDASSATARYYLSRAKIADGDVAGGLAGWHALLADLAPTDPRRAQLADELSAVERSGRLPELAIAAPTSGADASGAILGMVEGLAQRLRAHPDDPDGWVRLVRAYTVLGDAGKRDAALAEARRRYADRPDILRVLGDALKAPPMQRPAG